MGDYEGSKLGFLKTLKIIKREFGEDHIQYAKTLMNLSNVLSDLGDYEGAKAGYMKAIEINKKYFGEDHVEYANNL
jgi:tetratricopeptide (TPR) repeat protein